MYFIKLANQSNVAADSLKTLIKIHDHNHHNGMHRTLFLIAEFQLKQFTGSRILSQITPKSPKQNASVQG
jgi:hypothetical protein